MDEKKLKQLFALAREEAASPAPADFAGDVLRAIRCEPAAPPGSVTVWDHLDRLFPRLALAAAAVMLLCVAADWGLDAAGLPGVSDGAAQITSQFLFSPTSEDL